MTHKNDLPSCLQNLFRPMKNTKQNLRNNETKMSLRKHQTIKRAFAFNRGTQRSVSGNIGSKEKSRLKYPDLIAVKKISLSKHHLGLS